MHNVRGAACTIGAYILSEWLGRRYILPGGDGWCCDQPHVGTGVYYLPRWTLLRERLRDQLRKVDLQPAGGPVHANGVQDVPKERYDRRNRRHLGSGLRVYRGLL